MNSNQMVMQMLSHYGSNPMVKNMISMMQRGDQKGIEQLARNMCKEKGVDFDSEFSRFKSQFGIK